MKIYKKILFLFLMLAFASVYANKQNNDPTTSTNQRTPEQEASKQTEKLQSELNLTREQVNALYQINLRYAQARQNVTSRNEVMQIIKKKDEAIRKVLTDEQNDQLQSKRVNRQQVEVGNNIEYTRTNPQLRTSYRTDQNSSRRTESGENRNVRRSRSGDENSTRNNSAGDSRNTQSRPVRQQPARTYDGRSSTGSSRSNDNSSGRNNSTYSGATRTSTPSSSSSRSGNQSSNASSSQTTGGRR